MFKEVDLHMSFPNLTLLYMDLGHYGETVLLPDLSRFEKLESITIQQYSTNRVLLLSFCSDLQEKVKSVSCTAVLHY